MAKEELAEKTGSAEGGLNLQPIPLLNINLLPQEHRSIRRDFSWMGDRRIVWPSILLLVVFVGMSVRFIQLAETLDAKQTRLEYIQSEIKNNRTILDKIKQLDESLKIIAEKNKALKSIQVSKKRWVALFESISKVLPENMWLISILQNQPNQLEIKGLTYDFSEVANYMVNLEMEPTFVKVELVSIGSVRGRNAETEQYEFVMKCIINENLGLDVAE